MLIEFTNEYTRENTQTIMKEDGGITPNLTFVFVITPNKPTYENSC